MIHDALLCAAGEAPCIATYWVQRYWQLLVLRLLTGISVGGIFPLIYSLLGDLFAVQHRPTISAVVQIATGAGLAVGQLIAGFVGKDPCHRHCMSGICWTGNCCSWGTGRLGTKCCSQHHGSDFFGLCANRPKSWLAASFRDCFCPHNFAGVAHAADNR